MHESAYLIPTPNRASVDRIMINGSPPIALLFHQEYLNVREMMPYFQASVKVEATLRSIESGY